jgi:hypothetical protein
MSTAIYATTNVSDQQDIDDLNSEYLVIPQQLSTWIKLNERELEIHQENGLGERFLVSFDVRNTPEIIAAILDCYYGCHGKRPLPIPGWCSDFTALVEKEGKANG